MKRKLIALAVSIFVIATLIVPMTALANTGDITITGATEDNPFRAYRVYDLRVDSADNYSYTITGKFDEFEQKFTVGTLTAPTALREYLTDFSENKSQLVIYGDPHYNDIVGSVVRPMLTYVGGGVAHDFEVLTNAAGVATFAGMPLGYYLIVGEGIAFLTNNLEAREVKVSEKKDVPTLEKEIVGGETKIVGTKNIGDTVDYKLTLSVPDYSSFDTFEFIIRDTMSAGLTFNNDISVKINNLDVSTYTLSPSPAPYTFVLTFNDIMQYTIGDEIIITYSAVLNENAKVGIPETNAAYLLYSNNPFGDDKGETVPVITEVFTFELEVYKYTGDDENGREMPLPGAKFELAVDSATGDLVSVVLDDVNVGPGNYRVAKEGETGFNTMISPADGFIRIRGLDEGTYFLIETEAPSGYNAIAPIKIVITHIGNGNASIAIDDGAAVNGTLGVVEIKVENNQGMLFPGTGGIGQTIFIIAGLTLMAGAMILLFTRKKAKSK